MSPEHLGGVISRVVERLLFSDERVLLQAEIAEAALRAAYAQLKIDVAAGDESSVPVLWARLKTRMASVGGLFWTRAHQVPL